MLEKGKEYKTRGGYIAIVKEIRTYEQVYSNYRVKVDVLNPDRTHNRLVYYTIDGRYDIHGESEFDIIFLKTTK